MTAIRSLTAACLALAAQHALAQSTAPGLWEQTVQMKSNDGAMERAQAQMQQQLASMPPEQRRMVEQAMAQRNVTMGAQGTTVRICITPAQAARPPRPQVNGTDCTFREPQRSGNTWRYGYACTQPTRMTGEGETTLEGDKSFKGTMIVTSEAPGKTSRMTLQTTARWLAADCGAVKPYGQP